MNKPKTLVVMIVDPNKGHLKLVTSPIMVAPGKHTNIKNSVGELKSDMLGVVPLKMPKNMSSKIMVASASVWPM